MTIRLPFYKIIRVNARNRKSTCRRRLREREDWWELLRPGREGSLGAVSAKEQ